MPKRYGISRYLVISSLAWAMKQRLVILQLLLTILLAFESLGFIVSIRSHHNRDYTFFETLSVQHQAASIMTFYEPDDSFERVEVQDRYNSPKHAIHGALAGEKMIGAYDVYRPKNRAAPRADGTEENLLVLTARVDFGTHVNGHGGVVHGGIQGMMFDDIMGWGCDELLPAGKIPVTANLNVNYRAAVKEGSKVRLEAYLEKWEGRKLFWKARMLAAENGDNGEEVLYAEATSLYIVLKD